MKTAIYGVWHVHAPDYTRTAQKHGEVVGFYEPDDALAKAFGDLFGLPRFATPEELLASDAEGVIVCSATNTHADDMVKIARPDLSSEGMILAEDVAEAAAFFVEHRTNAVIDEIQIHRAGKAPFA